MKRVAIGHRLVLGTDDRGRRWFLDGRPLYIGTPLDIYCPVTTVGDERKSGWLRVRFDKEISQYGTMPAFHLWLGTNIGDARLVPPKDALFRWPQEEDGQ